jgi:DNA-binding ferritin-like protein
MLDDNEFSVELVPTQPAVDVCKPLTDLLSLLYAIYNLYYVAHWKSGSDSQYGDHELFGRMYGEIPDRLDALAEKIIGTFGADCICQVELLAATGTWLVRWKVAGSLLDQALMAEDDLQTTVESVYNFLKTNDSISLGMDDFLMGLASEHETNLYLLRQRGGECGIENQ